jgi:NADPH-dependent glutamate synthase beta subunit-like oxidoreductase
VTVFEALEKPGGMLRYGIPRYRLPEDQLDREIEEIIVKSGAEIRTGERAGSVDDLKAQGFDAVFLAIGAHQGLRMGIPGEDEFGIWDGVTFLRNIAAGDRVEVGSRVIVVGGGNTALDAARTALRVGAETVSILYRRTEQEMPADPEEVAAALEEEIDIQYLTLPTNVQRRGDELLVDCVKMALGEADESGRRRPKPIPGSEFQMRVDNIIVAIGQQPEDAEALGIDLTPRERAMVDRHTLETNADGVFAGGDFVLGPASVIEAVAQGRRAAAAIDEYLGGTGKIEEAFAEPEDLSDLPELAQGEATRLIPEHMVAGTRRESFDQVEQVYARQQARTEAARCLRCDLERR